eukprot:COSAG06_NODE_5584_length_3382_cov_15.606153_2_plen_124_part_00
MVICDEAAISIRLQHFSDDKLVPAWVLDLRVGGVSTQQLLDPIGSIGDPTQLPLFYFRRGLHAHLTTWRVLYFEHPHDVIVVLCRSVVQARFTSSIHSVCVALFVEQKFDDDWRRSMQVSHAQ